MTLTIALQWQPYEAERQSQSAIIHVVAALLRYLPILEELDIRLVEHFQMMFEQGHRVW